MNNKLKYKNKFNTYERFTDDKGLQNYENGICIDHINGEELTELQAKEIDLIVAYNNGELWWAEVEPTTAEERGIIKKIAERYKDWYKPNIDSIFK